MRILSFLHLGITGLKEVKDVELKFDVFHVTDGSNGTSNWFPVCFVCSPVASAVSPIICCRC